MIAARAHVELGQFGKAQTSATHAQALAPKLAAPRILKALTLHGLGKPRRAMFQLRRALDLSIERNERITATLLFQQIQAGLTEKYLAASTSPPQAISTRFPIRPLTHRSTRSPALCKPYLGQPMDPNAAGPAYGSGVG